MTIPSELDRVFGHQPTPVRRETITREEIAGKTIIVVRKQGQDMARAGRKRKDNVERYSNGQIKKSTVQRLNDMNAENTKEITRVVRMQPHRRGDDHKMQGNALGRFCRRTGCSEDTYNGVFYYATFKHRWRVAMGKPKGYENISGGGTGEGPSDEQVKTWLRKIIEIETMLCNKFGTWVFSLVHKLAIDDEDVDIRDENKGIVRSALGEIAVLTGSLSKNPHPFAGRA